MEERLTDESANNNKDIARDIASKTRHYCCYYSIFLSSLSLSLLVSMAGVLGVVVSNGEVSLQGNSLLDLGTPNAFSTAIKPPLLSSSSSSPRVPSTGPVAGSDGGSFLSETSLPINGRYCIFLYCNKF